MLMFEEATTGIQDFTQIPAAFENHAVTGLDTISETVAEIAPRVDQFLNNITTQVIVCS